MSAGRYDLEIEQGSDFVLNILYQDTNDNPVEISDPTDFLQILIERNQEAISSYHQMSKTFEKRGD